MAADRNQKRSAKPIDNGEPIVDVRQFQACTEMLRSGVPWAERPGLRSIFDLYNAAESRHEKKLGHTRGWRNSRNRSVRKPDDGGCSMTSSWLSRCPRLWGLGGRSYPWRRARSAKDPLQLRVRAGLFCAALLCPARTLLGRMGLALSPCRGMLLTQRAFEAALPPYQEWV